MNRRHFLGSVAALPFLGQIVFAMDTGTHNYKSGLVDELLADGKIVFVEFSTDWCPTCNSQKRTIAALRDDYPEYNSAMTFVRVNWDFFSDDPLSKRLDIPRRSTLVVLKGDEELGRLVAGTGTKRIKELLDKGLAAATA